MFQTLKFLQMKIRHLCSFFLLIMYVINKKRVTELKVYEQYDFAVDELMIDINFYPAYAGSV